MENALPKLALMTAVIATAYAATSPASATAQAPSWLEKRREEAMQAYTAEQRRAHPEAYRAEYERKALAGDVAAARLLSTELNTDPLERLRWKMHAARLGDGQSLDELLVDFGPTGRYSNSAKLKEFIDLGVDHARPAAMVAKAAYVQDLDPAAARELYSRAALQGHCIAQTMLAISYLDGVFTEVNEAKAYFWWLVVRLGNSSLSVAPEPPFVRHRLPFQVGASTTGASMECPRTAPRLEALASAPFSQEVKDLLLEWRPPQGAPDQLDRFSDERSVSADAQQPASPTVLQDPPSVREPAWKRVSLPRARRVAREASREDVYERLSPSVYVVLAASSKRSLRQHDGVMQGSAVSVESHTLLTNCHIIKGRPEILVVVDGVPKPATVQAARFETDTCVLHVPDVALKPIEGTRSADAVRVGEEVMAIGSPSGFTNSLSIGVLSQHRRDGGTRFIQTTAQISPGSSGGGLFDKFGNLIGITTFRIKDAEGLNFAVAIDEFVDVPPGR